VDTVVCDIISASFEIHKIKPEFGIKRAVQELLEKVGLNPEHINRFPHEFSGGQRQRLSLARALLSEADILLLVEPTSAVDTHTERRIAQRLRTYRQGRTTGVVTASPLMLEETDEVYFVIDGVVAAYGTHHELLSTSAPYRRAVLRTDDE
jgi:ABC-type multidrug transport system fused ATPase/permease subunit